MAIELETGVAGPLSLQADDGNAFLFAQAKVYNLAGAVVGSPITLTHVAGGLYQGSYTPAAAGKFTVQARFYSDAGFTTPASGYSIVSEELRVDSAITTVLGTPEGASLAADIQYLRRLLANGRKITNRTTGEITLYADDGTTPLRTATLKIANGSAGVGTLGTDDVHEQTAWVP